MKCKLCQQVEDHPRRDLQRAYAPHFGPMCLDKTCDNEPINSQFEKMEQYLRELSTEEIEGVCLKTSKK